MSEAELIRVLLVEDEPGDAQLTQIALRQVESVRFDITWAMSINEAQQQLAASRFDVLLLDLSLPDSEGLETVRAARQAAKAMPIIILTGCDDTDFALKALDAGATDYMVKGDFGYNGLIRSIRYALHRVKMEELIWRQAHFDALTQLPNRYMFHDRLAQGIKRSDRAALPLALLFMDLDHFKEINDTLGHSCGDSLLTEAAHRITACVRETDTVARLGGDEFTVILSEVTDTRNVDRIAEDIIQSLSRPYALGDKIACLSASIGITLYPNDAITIEELLKNADQAMYDAKNSGRNRFSYFTAPCKQAA